MLNKDKIKSELNTELEAIEMSDYLKEQIHYKSRRDKQRNPLKIAIAFMCLIIICSTTVIAGYYINSKINVNDETLPELDAMSIVKVNTVNDNTDENGFTEKYYDLYSELKRDLGIKLLDTPLAVENPYTVIRLDTDNKDFNIIKIDNYIIGDTSNFELIDLDNMYRFEHGNEYFTPVSLEIEMILSEEQMENGIERDFLGMYEYVESYISNQGYKVNIIQVSITPESEDLPSNFSSRKSAIFVANGIRYTLTGCVSLDTLKEIVNTMQ